MHRGGPGTPSMGNGVAGTPMRYAATMGTPQHSRRGFPAQPGGGTPMMPPQTSARSQMQARAKKRRFADKLIPPQVSVTMGTY